MSDYFLPYLQAACGLFATSLLLVLLGCLWLAAVPLYLSLAALIVSVKLWSKEKEEPLTTEGLLWT